MHLKKKKNANWKRNIKKRIKKNEDLDWEEIMAKKMFLLCFFFFRKSSKNSKSLNLYNTSVRYLID